MIFSKKKPEFHAYPSLPPFKSTKSKEDIVIVKVTAPNLLNNQFSDFIYALMSHERKLKMRSSEITLIGKLV